MSYVAAHVNCASLAPCLKPLRRSAARFTKSLLFSCPCWTRRRGV